MFSLKLLKLVRGYTVWVHSLKAPQSLRPQGFKALFFVNEQFDNKVFLYIYIYIIFSFTFIKKTTHQYIKEGYKR